MQIADLLGAKGIGVIALLPDTDISNAALLLSDQSVGVAAVIDEEEGLVGILSERDITRGLAEYGAAVVDVRVDQLMTRKIISCTPETSIEGAITLMQDNGIRHLPVVEDGNHLIAMISIRDLMDVQAEAYRQAG
ncbi:MAG: CBS domain-containing protein [Proteobacteria bacterium]|nr:CBS domain-containing protein [Pseudomonadota bacterium]